MPPQRNLLVNNCCEDYVVCSTKKYGAGEGARTLYLHLGKVALYQMSYARIKQGVMIRIKSRNQVMVEVPQPIIWCLQAELNRRHTDFQSVALPTELQRHVAGNFSGLGT